MLPQKLFSETAVSWNLEGEQIPAFQEKGNDTSNNFRS